MGFAFCSVTSHIPELSNIQLTISSYLHHGVDEEALHGAYWRMAYILGVSELFP